MSALDVAVIHFGTFLALGWGARRLIDRTMQRHGADLEDVHQQAGPHRRPRQVFLLGFWRQEP
jgi:hypothetical protein